MIFFLWGGGHLKKDTDIYNEIQANYMEHCRVLYAAKFELIVFWLKHIAYF